MKWLDLTCRIIEWISRLYKIIDKNPKFNRNRKGNKWIKAVPFYDHFLFIFKWINNLLLYYFKVVIKNIVIRQKTQQLLTFSGFVQFTLFTWEQRRTHMMVNAVLRKGIKKYFKEKVFFFMSIVTVLQLCIKIGINNKCYFCIYWCNFCLGLTARCYNITLGQCNV